SEAELERVAGWYWNEAHDDLVLIARKGATLELEMPARAALDLKPSSTPDRWALALSPDSTFTFERDEQGAPKVLVARDPHAPDAVRFERWQAEPELPSVDEVMALRKRGVDWDKLPALGAVRAEGKLEMPALKVSGTFASLFEGLTRYRLDLVTNRATAHVARDGESVWSSNTQVAGGATQDADEAMRARMDLASPVHVIVDWRPCFRELRVIARTP